MLITRDCLNAVGAFDEENFAIAYNDIDFCLRAGESWFRVVWTPFATLRHHESATRGSDETPENVERFTREKNAPKEKYGLNEFVDPAYSPWYARDGGRPALWLLQDLPPAR
jgi:O-antigen biosynthesis protein